MKLLVVSRPFAFHGGVERATAGLLGALAERGHAVEVLSWRRQPPIPGVVVRRLALPPLPAAARALALAWAVRELARRGRWDVVQSHERTLGQDVYRAGEGCHRAFLDALGRPRGRAFYHRVQLALERRVFRDTPRVVAISRAGAREIAALYDVPAARLAVVYNGVDLERFHPRNRATHREGARAEAALAAGAWTLLFVGSGFERKGLAVALRALAALGDRSSRMLVVGRDDPRPWQGLAERLGVAARVTWLGARPDIERWYAAADCLVLPTRYEPFGNVHLEALASGLPVVTSVRAGGAELLAPGCGAAVEPEDPGAVAAALEGVRAADARAQLGAARAAAEPYTFARQVVAFEEIYRALPRAKVDVP